MTVSPTARPGEAVKTTPAKLFEIAVALLIVLVRAATWHIPLVAALWHRAITVLVMAAEHRRGDARVHDLRAGGDRAAGI